MLEIYTLYQKNYVKRNNRWVSRDTQLFIYISDILRICSKFNHAEPAPVCNKRKPTTTIDTTLGKTLLEEHGRNMG